MDIWTKPPEFQKVPPASSDTESEVPEAPQNKQRKVRMPRVEGSRAHRCAIETELVERGRHASNQLDRLRGILKDPPDRPVLSLMPADVPALSVVYDPSVDTAARAAGLELLPAPPVAHIYRKGLGPGTGKCRGLTERGNFFPRTDYERPKFAELRGKDFK